jgi:hypothetical protein
MTISNTNGPYSEQEATMPPTVRVQQVKIKKVSDDIAGALADRSTITCSFCGKHSTLPDLSRALVERLSRPQELFCKFCIRNDFTARDNRHVLILTFRSVFGYMYFNGYKGKKRTLYWTQIQDYIRVHQEAGLANPAFRYDPESYLWFVDFRKVGATGRKIPVEEVKKTIINILVSLNIWSTAPGAKMATFYKKYAEAVDTFYTQRTRPENMKILGPTFKFCGLIDTKELPLDKTKEFSPQELIQ